MRETYRVKIVLHRITEIFIETSCNRTESKKDAKPDNFLQLNVTAHLV